MGLKINLYRRFAGLGAAALLGGAQFIAAHTLIAVNDPSRQQAQATTVQTTMLEAVFITPTPTPIRFTVQMPFEGKPRLTSYFDHNTPNYTRNGQVVIYTGDSSFDCDPYCYDGHSGLDYGMVVGTPLFAAANGTIIKTMQLSTGYGIHVVIKHDNNYHTLYAHMSEISVRVGQTVKAGDIIGLSGNTGNSSGPHLHFGVYRTTNSGSVPNETYATDPFGWRNKTTPDPLINFPTTGKGTAATCLWRSDDKDFYHCNDILIEDSGLQAAILTGDWIQSSIGLDGSHYISNTENIEDVAHADWAVMITQSGLYQIDAFIPSRNATTRQAKYRIYTGNNIWQEVLLDQLPYNDEWVSLGNYELPVGNSHVWLSANTGEPANKTRVAADAVRFRRLGAASLPKPSPSITPTTVITPSVTPAATITITPTAKATITPTASATVTPTATPTITRLNLPLLINPEQP